MNSLLFNTKKHIQFIFESFLNYVAQAKYVQAIQTYNEFKSFFTQTDQTIQNEQNFRITYEVGQIYYQQGNKDNLSLQYLQKSQWIGMHMYRDQDVLSMKAKLMIGNLNFKKKMIYQALQDYQQTIRILFIIQTQITKQDKFVVVKQIAEKLAELQENSYKLFQSHIQNDIIQNILKNYFRFIGQRQDKNWFPSQLSSQLIESIFQNNEYTVTFFTLIQIKIIVNLNNQNQNLKLIRLCHSLLKQNQKDQNKFQILFFKMICNWLNFIIEQKIDIFSFEDKIIYLIYSYASNINTQILNQNYQLSILTNYFLSNYYWARNLKQEAFVISIEVIYLIDFKWKLKLSESNDLYFKNQILIRILSNVGYFLYQSKLYQESVQFYHGLLNIIKKQKDAQFYFQKLLQMADMHYALKREEEALSKYQECLKILQQRYQTHTRMYFRIQKLANYITDNMTIHSDSISQQSLSDIFSFAQNNVIFEKQNKNQNNCRIYEIQHQINSQQNYNVVSKYYIKTLYKLALHFFKLFNYDQALKYAQKLIFIVENAGDYQTQQFAIYLCIQGRILEKKKKYDKALKDFQKALKILSKLKKYSLNMSETLFYIGKLHLNYFQPTNSTQYFQKCILTIKKYYGKPNRLYIQAVEKLAEAKFSLQLYNESFKKYKECYEICVQLYGEKDDLTKNIWQSLENMRTINQKEKKDIF